MDPDLIVIGGGAAALAAARTARRRGAAVTVITEGSLGGDCTWHGCIPSKTLLAAAARGVGFGAAMQQVRSTVARVAATEDSTTLRREGIQVLEGTARFVGRQRVTVDGRRLSFDRAVLATGAEPLPAPVPGLGPAAPLSTDDIWDLTDQPSSLIVLGAGPVGAELSQALARLGTAVTLVEAHERVLPAEEPAAGAAVADALRRDGVAVMTGSPASGAGTASGGVELTLADGRTAVAERVLVAAGRRPRTADVDPEAAGVVLLPSGHVRTDRHLRTSAPCVWAAGDVTGRAPWTHGADEMGRVAATNALARRPWRRFHDGRMPSVTYTSPEVARVGLSEAVAAATVRGARVAEVPVGEVDRAVTAGRTAGYIKLIVGPRTVTRGLAGGRLLGATIVADQAGEMIALPVLAMTTGMFPARLALAVQAYPTWALGVRQAAAQLFSDGRAARSG